MNAHSRRSLLKFVGAGIAALATTKTFSGQEGGSGPAHFGFIFEPDFLARFDKTTQTVSHVSPRIVPKDLGRFLPALLSPDQPTEQQAEEWFKSKYSTCCSGPLPEFDSTNGLDARAGVSFYGEPFINDVVAHTRQRQKKLLMPDGTIADQVTSYPQDKVVLDIYSSLGSNAITVLDDPLGYRLGRSASAPTPLIGSSITTAAAEKGQNIYRAPWARVWMAYAETHPLVPCEYRNVYHVRYDVFIAPDCDWSGWSGCQWDKGGYNLARIHVGNVPGQKCLVVFDNLHPWVCINTCNLPSIRLDFSALQSRIQQALAGLALPGWLIPSLAYLLATLALSAGVLALA